MRIYHKRQADRFQRSIKFVEKHSQEFAAGSRALTLADQLKEVAHQLETTPEKTPGVKSNVPASGKLAALNGLREELGQIARTAKAIEAHDPDFNNTFILPDKRRKDDLAKAAKQFIKDASANRQAFAEYEVQDDFLDVLQSKLDTYNETQSVSAPSRQGSGATLSETGEAVQKGSQLLDTLDVIVRNKFRNNDAMMSEWLDASTVEAMKRKSKKNAG